MSAVFKDKRVYAIAEMPTSEYEGRCHPSSTKKPAQEGTGSGILWTTTRVDHQEGQHVLTIKKRTDRTILLSLFTRLEGSKEPPRQILQMRVDKFSCFEKALEAFTQLGQRFADGDIKQEDLKKQRDLMLDKIKDGPILKRPAAAQPAQSTKSVKSADKAQPTDGNSVDHSKFTEHASNAKAAPKLAQASADTPSTADTKGGKTTPKRVRFAGAETQLASAPSTPRSSPIIKKGKIADPPHRSMLDEF